MVYFPQSSKTNLCRNITSILLSLPSYDPFFDKKNKNEYIETRYDSRLIDIFEKLGAELRDGKTFERKRPGHKSSLKIVEIPTMMLDAFYISEYDGAEWIWCNISKKYKDVLLGDVVRKGEVDETYGEIKMNPCMINSDNNLPNVQHRLNEIAQCEKFLISNNIHFV
jgi:hypothetical protein